MPQTRHVPSVGPTAHVPLKHGIAQRVRGAALSNPILVVRHVVSGVAMVIALGYLACTQLAIRLTIMHSLERLRSLLRRQSLKRGNTTGIGSVLVELEAVIDALLGRDDGSLRVLRGELLLHHTLLIALQVQRGKKLVLDTSTFALS